MDSLLVNVEPLKQSLFQDFGSVIENPLELGLNDQNAFPKGLEANQGTAMKFPDISPLTNNYDKISAHAHAQSVINMFVCSPRKLLASPDSLRQGLFALHIMERHCYTTQTFVPLGLNHRNPGTMYLVIVAPTLPASLGGGPDVQNVRAFIAHGCQAVTYGVGTWHAPMVVVGDQAVAFVVTQFMNGVSNDDCEEINLISKEGQGINIAVPHFGSNHAYR